MIQGVGLGNLIQFSAGRARVRLRGRVSGRVRVRVRVWGEG